jgi:hypothetical protein
MARNFAQFYGEYSDRVLRAVYVCTGIGNSRTTRSARPSPVTRSVLPHPDCGPLFFEVAATLPAWRLSAP